METSDELSPALQGKSLSAKLSFARTIMEAGRSRRFALADDERKILASYIVELQFGRDVDRSLLLSVDKIVRQYEQHLIALTRSVR